MKYNNAIWMVMRSCATLLLLPTRDFRRIWVQILYRTQNYFDLLAFNKNLTFITDFFQAYCTCQF